VNHFGHKMAINDNYGHSAEELYAKYLQFTGIMLEEYNAIEIAGIMATQALSLYRTALSEEDYQKMIEMIYDNRNEVKVFSK
jgi:hypothetical protein